MNYKVNDNAQRNQTKTGKNHFCYMYNKVYGGNHQQTPLPASSSNSYRVANDAYLQQVISPNPQQDRTPAPWGGPGEGLLPASSSNSDGVAFLQPRVAGIARYPG